MNGSKKIRKLSKRSGEQGPLISMEAVVSQSSTGEVVPQNNRSPRRNKNQNYGVRYFLI